MRMVLLLMTNLLLCIDAWSTRNGADDVVMAELYTPNADENMVA